MPNYTLIDTKTVASSTPTVSFTGIPATYRDLVIFIAARNAQNNYGGFGMYFNNTNSNIQYRFMRGFDATSNQTGVRSDSIDIAQMMQSGDTPSNMFTNCEFYITNYSSSTQIKKFRADSGRAISQSGGTNTSIRMANGTWNDTSVINRVDLSIFTDNFLTGSKFWLYGISI